MNDSVCFGTPTEAERLRWLEIAEDGEDTFLLDDSPAPSRSCWSPAFLPSQFVGYCAIILPYAATRRITGTGIRLQEQAELAHSYRSTQPFEAFFLFDRVYCR
jgi:hypothetical protein